MWLAGNGGGGGPIGEGPSFLSLSHSLFSSPFLSLSIVEKRERFLVGGGIGLSIGLLFPLSLDSLSLSQDGSLIYRHKWIN